MANFQVSDLNCLEPDQLIKVIEEAQRLLDKTYTLNSIDLKCPQCGQSEELRMEAYHWFDWTPNGAALDIDCDPAWGAECACNCPECEFAGRVLDFLRPVS
jgi:hypothetical protein